MNTNKHIWSKQDREPFVEDWQKRVDTVEDYMENLVDVWHEWAGDWLVAGEDVRLYDFLGLEENEITTWVRDGVVSHRILAMWLNDEY